ncbi:hypothetical protein ABFS82_09G082500 [Erythranthe guttata]|uniref:BURP domain-containing protein n=1 Tax=Erythranthe guttata TaxID=4155 RepID=A0A022PZJ9_ERYGU|nr:PREDICTED: uncharacterized protein LOC105975625 [Erythranthe guttata]EYU21757.1 hypothetical protein MIMGU_mgv1a016683mg [Erythranthe guttata]|eukprot:XP_012856269.1 PREDICTED: uncharacterized protein LOC105975625 [Erythranthe guttata]
MNPNMQMFIVVLTLVVFAAGVHARILPDYYAPIMDSSSSSSADKHLNKPVYSVIEVVCDWLVRVTDSAGYINILCDKANIVIIPSAGLGKTDSPAPPAPDPASGKRPLVAYS